MFINIRRTSPSSYLITVTQQKVYKVNKSVAMTVPLNRGIDLHKQIICNKTNYKIQIDLMI